MEENKVHKLWSYIELTKNWVNSDTSSLDDISSSWYERREILQNNSKEYKDFIIELKREHWTT